MNARDAESIFAIELSPAPADIPLIEEIFSAAGFDISSWHDRETGVASVRIFCECREQALRLLERVETVLEPWRDFLQGAFPEPRPITIQRQDWSHSWKKHFHAFRASKRLLIKPTWETLTAEPGDIVLEIDPGMCFGTGYHGTTRACLEFMDDLAVELGPVSFLDAGCGSGILSLAAHALGYGPIHAFDHDPEAVRTTRENLAAAGIDAVRVATAAVQEFTAPLRFRVMAVNILATVLLQHREAIAGWLDAAAGPSFLLLAGILDEQYEEVRQAYCELGFREVRTRRIDEWTSGCFQRF